MDNRKRNNQLKIYLTYEEKEVFEKKMRLANCKTMSHFLRKCVLEKEIYVVDLEPFRNLQWLLSNATNNINQIAKATSFYFVPFLFCPLLSLSFQLLFLILSFPLACFQSLI